jgi:hypothetical protein
VLFVVMYAISTTDMRKFVALAQSVSAAFNADVMQGQQPSAIMTARTRRSSQTYDTGSSPWPDGPAAIKAALEDYAIGQGLGGEVEVGLAPQGIVIRLNDALLFSSGRAHLDDHAVKLSAGRGHRQAAAEPDPRRGQHRRPAARRRSVRRQLGALDRPGSGRRSKAMVEQGHGSRPSLGAGQRPVQPDRAQHDDASRAKNRRVDIVVIYRPRPQAADAGCRALVPMSRNFASRASPQPALISPGVTEREAPNPAGRRAILVLGVPLGLAAAGALVFTQMSAAKPARSARARTR